eukprot:CAMPEP_0195255968 /NCGR_PEP_ID=MMETSP0706-20130129/5960_1 /TAXON_ID=33640 /ORGANISM="Asterionellopsis glacialis, Strain CCMP134" /LENGTH=183 /DNA_ID=CAMNT_0040308929 /DNA_START=69 /DNA_END=620 /DNA_ORIENTATION=+
MSKYMSALALLVATLCSHSVESFVVTPPSSQRIATPPLHMSSSPEAFEIMVDLPPSTNDLKAQMRIAPILDVPSELIEVRYDLPFGLDVAPKDGMAVCTKDGTGGERVGDILRFTSQWTMGLPRGDGLVTTAASFAGGLTWQCSMFDVMRAGAWGEVVEALTSNVESRTDQVVLIFERPLAQE